jgi:hypothetical protein
MRAGGCVSEGGGGGWRVSEGGKAGESGLRAGWGVRRAAGGR